MQGQNGAVHPTRFDEIAVTVDFHCNSACRFCIVQEGMNRYRGLELARFEKLAEENRLSRKYRRVLFTGGEVTLENRLPAFIRTARASGAFEHIRLQTNARRLADRAFAQSLVAEGVDEFFVSLHGPDPAVQDAISQRPGSFDEAVRGIANVLELGAHVLTNTVITTYNVAVLDAIVERVADLGVRQMELWNYLPMADHDDQQNLIAPLTDVMPALTRALERCRARQVSAVVKYVPRCLLGAHADALDNAQPDVMIVESFWDEFPRFNCLYEAVCEHSERCLGLHHDYVNKFGWEEERLVPVARTRPWREADPNVDSRPRGGTHPAWEALVDGLPAGAGRLEQVQLTRQQARLRFRLPSGGSVEVVLAGRDDQAPAYARSASFNIFYSAAEGAMGPADLETLMREVIARVDARDRGQLSLDARKGLTAVRS
jgi:molybdenum cofactor biosynthesis enzyme MoaA